MGILVPKPRVRCCSVTRADSISSCPVKKMSTSRGSGCVMWIHCGLDVVRLGRLGVHDDRVQDARPGTRTAACRRPSAMYLRARCAPKGEGGGDGGCSDSCSGLGGLGGGLGGGFGGFGFGGGFEDSGGLRQPRLRDIQDRPEPRGPSPGAC
eukprot:scaffold39301_cov63-Phaeocystis_antarctica.AAC.3